MNEQQTFKSPEDATWVTVDFLSGVELLPLAQPVSHGSIHRAGTASGVRAAHANVITTCFRLIVFYVMQCGIVAQP